MRTLEFMRQMVLQVVLGCVTALLILAAAFVSKSLTVAICAILSTFISFSAGIYCMLPYRQALIERSKRYE